MLKTAIYIYIYIYINILVSCPSLKMVKTPIVYVYQRVPQAVETVKKEGMKKGSQPQMAFTAGWSEGRPDQSVKHDGRARPTNENARKWREIMRNQLLTHLLILLINFPINHQFISCFPIQCSRKRLFTSNHQVPAYAEILKVKALSPYHFLCLKRGMPLLAILNDWIPLIRNISEIRSTWFHHGISKLHLLKLHLFRTVHRCS